MNRISACLITLDEEEDLPRALDSLKDIADEIVIVDSGSNDGTERIARERGAKFLTRPWTRYDEQKNFAAAAASNEWILSLDADEELSGFLRTSILEWKKNQPKFSVYEMARKTWYLGKWIHHSGWYPDYQRRLYRHDAAKFDGIIHESLKFKGQAGRLNGDLLHYTVRTFAEHQNKVERYAALAGERLYQEGKRSWRAAVWFASPWSWFQNFFLRGGFLDGYQGFLIASMAARAVRSKYRKLGQLVAEAARQQRS